MTRRHGHRVASCLALLALAAGCGTSLDFEASTRVSADGSIVRSARLVGPGKKDEIAARYVLLPGRWLRDTRARPQPGGKEERVTVDVYEMTQTRRPGEPLAPDHVRRSTVSNRTIRNEPRLTVDRGWFVTTFTYDERFTDLVTPEGFERAARELYALACDRLAADLAPQASPPLRVDEMRQAIAASHDPLFERYVQRLHTLGPRAFIADAALQDQAEADMEPEAIAARLVRALPPRVDRDVDLWSSLVDGATKRLGASFDERFARFSDDLFGVYGFLFFQSYGFHVDLDLPGSLVETNATARSPARLVWRFSYEDFWDRPLVLTARSRLWHPWRLTLAAAPIPVFGTALWYRARRRARARYDGG